VPVAQLKNVSQKKLHVIIKNMQGKKELEPKLMYRVTLADLVSENNI